VNNVGNIHAPVNHGPKSWGISAPLASSDFVEAVHRHRPTFMIAPPKLIYLYIHRQTHMGHIKYFDIIQADFSKIYKKIDLSQAENNSTRQFFIHKLGATHFSVR